MTVGVPPKQPGLLTRQRFCRPGRTRDRLGRCCAGNVSCYSPKRCSPPRRRHPLRYNSFPPVDISQTAGENLRAVLHSLFGPRILATASTVGGTRDAHARRTTDRSDCPRAQRISESLLRRAQSSARVPNADSSCRLVMRRWTHTAQTNAGRPDEREGFSMGFRRRVRRRALVAGAVGGAAIAHHERKKAGEQAYDEAPADDQAGPGACRRRPGPGAICAPSGGPGRRDRTPRTIAHLGRAHRRGVRGGQGENTRDLNACRITRRC